MNNTKENVYFITLIVKYSRMCQQGANLGLFIIHYDHIHACQLFNQFMINYSTLKLVFD